MPGIGQETLCRTAPRRFLIVPDVERERAEVVRAAATSDGSVQSEGLSVRQPEPDATDAPGGDIRPALSGEPEDDVAGALAVSKAGVVEAARYGWVREGDDTTTDLQLRQSPHVFGRRTDVLYRSVLRKRPVRPKLLPLASGYLLAAWVQADFSPVWAHRAASVTVDFPLPKLARLNGESQASWGFPSAPLPEDSGGTMGYLMGLDMVQFPDTEEVLLFQVTTEDPATPGSKRVLFTHASTTDGGTWVERSRRYFDGNIPDIVLDATGDGVADDTYCPVAVSAELLESGRIVLLLSTTHYTWSLVSDDRGDSWTPYLVATHPTDELYWGHGIGSTLLRNGVAAFVLSRRDAVNDPSEVRVVLTADGINFSSQISVASNVSTVDTAITVSPDGWPHIYGTAHRVLNPDGAAYSYRDWLWGRRWKRREATLNMGVSSLLPWYSTGQLTRSSLAFHCIESSPSGSYAAPSAPQYVGFTSLDAVCWRGQTVLAVTFQQEANDAVPYNPEIGQLGTPATLEAAALVVYRANHWQPLQEKLGQAHPELDTWSPGYPAAGHIYNRTWDCYHAPDQLGYTPVGAGLVSFTYGATSYMKLDSSAGARRYYTDGTLPVASASRDGVVRAVCQITSGGSSASIAAGISFGLNNAGNMSAMYVMLEKVVGGQKVTFHNAIAAIDVGNATFTSDQWLEILLMSRQNGANWDADCYVRSYPVSTDPDWDEPYTHLGTITNAAPLGGGADFLAWGNIVDDIPAVTYWKSVHLSRTSQQGYVALEQRGISYTDTDVENNTSSEGTGEPPLDSGIDNHMRTSCATASPAQYMVRGVNVTWRGEATTQGEYAYTSGRDFSAENLLKLPVLREWRAVDNNTEVEIVLKAFGSDKWRPNALAVFGRNFPAMTVEMNDTDSWGAPSISYTLGYWSTGVTPDRYTHLWGFNSLGWTYTTSAKRLTVFSAGASAAPWRPHQFASSRTGPKFYLVFFDGSAGVGTPYVYRIVDNTEDTLTLDMSIVAGDHNTHTRLWCIYSDRFATQLEWKYPAGSPNTHVTGYTYLRLVIPAAYYRDPDVDSHRAGFLMLGHAIDLSAPSVAWGWGRAQGSGAEVAYDGAGVASVLRRSAPRRTFRLDFGHLAPPREASAAHSSPAVALADAKQTWAHWLDVVRRLEVDGTEAVLAWEGDRMAADSADTEEVQVASDPLDLMPVRVTSPGEVEHVAWEQADLNLSAGDTTLPRPVAVIRGIGFTEQF